MQSKMSYDLGPRLKCITVAHLELLVSRQNRNKVLENLLFVKPPILCCESTAFCHVLDWWDSTLEKIPFLRNGYKTTDLIKI